MDNETYFKEPKNDLHDLAEQKRIDDIEAQKARGEFLKAKNKDNLTPKDVEIILQGSFDFIDNLMKDKPPQFNEEQFVKYIITSAKFYSNLKFPKVVDEKTMNQVIDDFERQEY